MFDNRLGGLSSEIVCMIDRVCTNKTIRYYSDEWSCKDDGRYGKIIEQFYLEPGAVHGECKADMPGLELKSKNILTKSNSINIAYFDRPENDAGVNMVIQAYNKIKDNLLFEEFYFDKETNEIQIKRATLYQGLTFDNFRFNVKMRNMSFDVNKNDLKDTYEKTIPLFNDLDA